MQCRTPAGVLLLRTPFIFERTRSQDGIVVEDIMPTMLPLCLKRDPRHPYISGDHIRSQIRRLGGMLVCHTLTLLRYQVARAVWEVKLETAMSDDDLPMLIVQCQNANGMTVSRSGE